jgi:hypothetical protein
VAAAHAMRENDRSRGTGGRRRETLTVETL